MTSSVKLLLVDDDPAMLALVESWLGQEGYAVLTASSGEEALQVFTQEDPDVVVSDLIMPGMNGIELLRQLRMLSEDVPFILVTSYGSIPSAVEAMRTGADDYLSKPLHPDEMKIVVERAIQQRELRREVSRLRSEVGERFSFERIVGHSKAMKKVVGLAQRVAARDATVLIHGESGSGKELLARAIHQASPRRDRPFVPVDCGALADNLLESELFGHVRGAFSGAIRTRRGLFVEADGGTLFLDEIGNLSVNLQGKLLRALQEREVKPVGANNSQAVDVRILAATNSDLDAARKQGAFRDDLYYRLAVVSIHMPPLRERSEDIPALCDFFLARVAGSGSPKQLTAAAQELVLAHPWPGNVRELENAMQRGALLAEGDEIGPEHLPAALDGRPAEKSLAEVAADTRRRVEREVVQAALRETGGNRTQAAQLLGISRSSLYNRLKELEIDE